MLWGLSSQILCILPTSHQRPLNQDSLFKNPNLYVVCDLGVAFQMCETRDQLRENPPFDGSLLRLHIGSASHPTNGKLRSLEHNMAQLRVSLNSAKTILPTFTHWNKLTSSPQNTDNHQTAIKSILRSDANKVIGHVWKRCYKVQLNDETWRWVEKCRKLKALITVARISKHDALKLGYRGKSREAK